MTSTTELNRAIAKAKGLEYMARPADVRVMAWCEPHIGGRVFVDGQAWADSADVALAELWPDLSHPDYWFVSHRPSTDDAEIYEVVRMVPHGMETESVAEGPTLAIAICRAWLKMKGVEVE